ncbi:MAG: hypothetical protein OXH08_01485 [Gammaproteobacteria bacterium]|nr:hypothetical protein [Gammaproteobacteria bacterium]MDE2716622.1 hypothetical protein [Chloroflexota bacterium]
MLPIMAKPEDALAVVDYLKTKVTGATVGDARATLPGPVLDRRKVAAYKAWGLVTQEGDRFRLTSRGRRLARASDENRTRIFAEIISETYVYRLAAEWMHHHDRDMVPISDLAAHWFEHVPSELGTDNEQTIRNQVACFMGLAQAAGLGRYVKGRRGKSTRLEVNRTGLAEFVTGLQPSLQSSEQRDTDADSENGTSALAEESGDLSESALDGSESGDRDETAASSASRLSVASPESPMGLGQLGMPDVRLNLEIRIDASVTPEQIDSIFASMAKHLYQRDDEGQ